MGIVRRPRRLTQTVSAAEWRNDAHTTAGRSDAASSSMADPPGSMVAGDVASADMV